MSARNGWLARFFPPTKSKPMKGPVMMSAGLGRFGRRTFLSLALASIPFFGLNVEKAHALTQYRLRVTPSAQGSSSNGYTPTHYVSTTGNATMTQGTYNAAASSSTPCTITVACAFAVAGNIVQLGPGNFAGARTGTATDPIFVPANAGSSGNPIIFCAQYPAAYNIDTGLYTQFARTDDLTPGSGTNCPIWGSRSYCILDGIYFNYAQGAMPWTRGIIYFGYQPTGMEVRRLLFDRTDLQGLDDGDNWNCIHYHGAISCKVRDTWFRGGYDDNPGAGPTHNEACITLYGATDATIENCLFATLTTAFYAKGTDAGVGNTGRIRYCSGTGLAIGIELATTLDTGTGVFEAYQNLIILGGSEPARCIGFDNATTGSRYFKVYNNTVIVTGDSNEGPVYVATPFNGTGCEFYNNIIASFVNTSQVMFNAQSALTNWTIWNYNRIYENGQTPQYFYAGTGTVSGLSNWQGASGRDLNSSEGDPQFANQSAGNYRLAGGSPCLTAGNTGGPIGCYITGSEDIGLRTSPTYP